MKTLKIVSLSHGIINTIKDTPKELQKIKMACSGFDDRDFRKYFELETDDFQGLSIVID